MKQNSKRDIIIIISIIIISLLGYFIYNKIISSTNANSAEIIYNKEVIVVVDFQKNKVDIKQTQPDIDDSYNKIYPIVNLEDNTVTLLGDYEVKSVRQEVVIKFDFDKKSMQIISEQSPNNICSNLGESTLNPLICIPNNIRIKFITSASSDIDEEV